MATLLPWTDKQLEEVRHLYRDQGIPEWETMTPEEIEKEALDQQLIDEAQFGVEYDESTGTYYLAT